MKIAIDNNATTRGHGQSNLTKGRTAAAHGLFNGIRQVAPMCTPCNTCFLGPTRVHNPDDISIGSAVFLAKLTAESHYTLQRAAPYPLIIAHLNPHLIRASLGYTRIFNENGISIGLAVFAQLTAVCLYTLQGAAPSSLKIARSHGGSGPHLIHGSSGPPESITQIAS